MFYITGAQRCGIICLKVQSDEEEFTQVETTGPRLPPHFESHFLINDHRDKGTFTFPATLRERCVCVSGLVFSPLINGVYYSVLLNFISSGPLQDIEQALSFLPLSPPVAARL